MHRICDCSLDTPWRFSAFAGATEKAAGGTMPACRFNQPQTMEKERLGKEM
jgi:hypothetical protein